jgi:hypothetical protein
MTWMFQLLLVNPDREHKLHLLNKTSNMRCGSASQRLGKAWAFQLLLVNPDEETYYM